METFMAYSGWTVGIIGAILSAIGIYLAVQALEKKEPQCYYKTFRNIIKLSQEDKLRITYNGNEVDRVSTTYIFFWNKGKKPIVSEDLRSLPTISFSSKYESKVLDYKVVKVTKDDIHFLVSECANNVLQLRFDYLDKNDGAVIEVKHTGILDIKPVIHGTILQVPTGIIPKELTVESLSRKSIKQKLIDFFRSMSNGGWRIYLVIIVLAIFTGFLVNAYIENMQHEAINQATLRYFGEMFVSTAEKNTMIASEALATSEKRKTYVAIATSVAQGTKMVRATKTPIRATKTPISTTPVPPRKNETHEWENQEGWQSTISIFLLAASITFLLLPIFFYLFVYDKPPYPKSLDIQVSIIHYPTE